MRSLRDNVQSQIEGLCARGDELAEAEKFVEALEAYRLAYMRLSQPSADTLSI